MLRPITLVRNNGIALYRQITEGLIEQIQRGYLQPGARLPSSRQLGEQLGVHRKNVVQAYEELLLQDWISTSRGRGTFVSTDLPDMEARTLVAIPELNPAPASAPIKLPEYLKIEESVNHLPYHLDDGLPDPRLIPLTELERAWKSALRRGNQYHRLGYASPQGLLPLRKALADYLGATRGLMVGPEHVLLTRGVTHALHLCLTALVEPGDKVIVPELNWHNGNNSIRYHGAELLQARIDDKGLDTEHVAELLEQHDVRLIYLTPHHQYPTTVIMPAARRIRLLELARQHGLFVFEDDYDFDFHYGNVPIMPLASARHDGRLLYAGSFTKAISPAFRLGYLVGEPALIEQLTRLRRIVDRQGDPALEHAVLELFRLEVLPRSLRRARGIYQRRRDHLGQALQSELGGLVDFRTPDGGMAIWTTFAKEVNLVRASKRAYQMGLSFSDGSQYPGDRNGTRLGFASMNEEELEEAVRILGKAIKG
ncbi:MAG: PLP-dependent aminotransferase family protein [Bacteroidota bacterium]